MNSSNTIRFKASRFGCAVVVLVAVGLISALGGCDLPSALTGDLFLQFNPIDYGPNIGCVSAARPIIADNPAARVSATSCSDGSLKAMARG